MQSCTLPHLVLPGSLFACKVDDFQTSVANSIQKGDKVSLSGSRDNRSFSAAKPSHSCSVAEASSVSLLLGSLLEIRKGLYVPIDNFTIVMSPTAVPLLSSWKAVVEARITR